MSSNRTSALALDALIRERPEHAVITKLARGLLDGQRQGDHVIASGSDRHGFWLVDDDSPGRRWYRRSDGTHPYVIGNTQYSFLSGHREDGRPKEVGIAEDVARNAAFFKKLRFGLHGDYYVHPTEKPYLDDRGRPTDDGDF